MAVKRLADDKIARAIFVRRNVGQSLSKNVGRWNRYCENMEGSSASIIQKRGWIRSRTTKTPIRARWFEADEDRWPIESDTRTDPRDKVIRIQPPPVG